MMKRIALVGSEKDKDEGFSVLMKCNEFIHCLKDEEYCVNENVIKILKEREIKFIMIAELSHSS